MKTLKDRVRGGEIIYVTKGTPVSEVASLLAEQGIGAVPVLDGERLAGIFSERDILVRVVVAGKDLARTKVETVMTRKLVTAGPSDSPDLCLRKMQEAGCRHLPILDGRDLIGFVSIKDLLMTELKQRSREIRNLKWMMWAESIPSEPMSATWRCGGCSTRVHGEIPPTRCPRCKASRVQFSIVADTISR